MSNVRQLPMRPKPAPRPGSAYRQIAWIMEAADEARLASQHELADILIDRARQMRDDLSMVEGRAA